MESLRKLGAIPEFQAFQAALANRFEALARRLTECSSFEEYKEVLGCLRAYEEVFQLNDLVVGKADALDEYRSESAQRQRDADALARATFLASRLWEPGVPVRDQQ